MYPTIPKKMIKSFLKLLFVVLLCWLTPILAFTQKKYVEGEIITTYLDTIHGFIFNRPEFTNKDQVIFSMDRSGELLDTYYPDQITKVIIDKKEFLSVPAIFDDKAQILFLRRICFGHYNLFEGYQETGDKIFFLETENDEVIHLPKEMKHEWLTEYFSGNNFNPRRIYYDDVSLINLVSKYSSWMQPETFVYQREKFNPTINIGLKIGLNVSLMEFTDKLNVNQGDNFKPELGLQGGVVFNIDMIRNLQFSAELLYATTCGSYSDTVKYDFERADLNIPVLLRYVVRSDSRFDPYVNIGVDGRILIKERFEHIFGEEKIDFEPPKGTIGMLIGAGSFIRLTHELDLFIDFRYTVSSYLAHSWPKKTYTLRHQVFSFTTGIMF